MMIALADSGDIIAALGGSNTSHIGEPGNRSLLKWRQQVKKVRTRITVINRFAGKYRAKSLQYGIAAASPELIAKVKDLLEKSITSEGSKTRNLSLNPGAQLSPNDPVQDTPKQKFKLGTLEKKNGEGLSFKLDDVLKDHRALYTIQLVLTLLAFKILPDEAVVGLIIITVITLDSKQEGTTATYNPVGRTVSRKGLLLLLCFGTFGVVNAQGDSEDGKRECPSESLDLPYNVQLAAWTFVAWIMIAVIDGIINHRPLVPATAAPLPAVPAPALPVPAVPVPAVPAPAVPAPAVPVPAVPAPAVPVPAVPVPAVPAPAVPAPAPAVLMGFDIMHAFEDDPAAARKNDPDFHIPPSL